MRFLVLSLAVMLALAAAACSADEAEPSDAAPLVDLDLAPDGLGDVAFGLDPDTVVADISARVGGPDHDTDWIPAESNIYGSCPGQRMRAIGWGSLVTIFIDDGESELGGWFFTYTYGYDYSLNMGGIDSRDLALMTPAGLSLGSTVAELTAAYPDVVIDGDAALDVWSFQTDAAGFRGLLSGDTDTDTVTLIEPLTGCD